MRGERPVEAQGGVTRNPMKEVSKTSDRSRPKVDFPGDAGKRRQRIKRALKANAETHCRLAQ